MKIKYYLRGLGVGIVITTLILLIVFNTTGKNISDEEIIDRAKSLGMVMKETDEEPVSGKLLDSFGQKDPDSSQSVTTKAAVSEKDDTSKSTDTATDGAIDNSKNNNNRLEPNDTTGSGLASVNKTADDTSSTSTEAITVKNDPEPDEKEGFKDIVPKTPAKGTRVTIKIESGDVSRNVCEKLYAEGVIENAADFNDYLQDTNYDNFLHGGDHVLVVGDDYETIAKKLMGRIEE